MSENEVIRAALEALGWRTSVAEVRAWCSRKGVVPSDAFDGKVRAILLLESSHAVLVEQAADLSAELEERIRFLQRQREDLP